MFDSDMPGSVPGDPSPVPLERLEAQICELAGHLTAATQEPTAGPPSNVSAMS